jgi:hypothetical protein
LVPTPLHRLKARLRSLDPNHRFYSDESPIIS